MILIMVFDCTIRRPAALAAASLALVGCAAVSRASADDGRIHVVATVYPLAEAAQRVGGDVVAVDSLAAPGVEPHDLELTPHQVEAIDEADLVLYVGGGFQPGVEDALAEASGVMLDATSFVRRPADEGALPDPHVWLDPTLFGRIVDEVSDALSDVDPAHAETFGGNAENHLRQLEALDADYRRGLADCDRRLIVSSHGAFGYLAARYGLMQVSISGSSPEAEPTPQRIDELRDVVEREGLTTIFTEELASPEAAETLAAETGATTAVLSPLESLTQEELSIGANYVSVMRENLGRLRDALGCA